MVEEGGKSRGVAVLQRGLKGSAIDRHRAAVAHLQVGRQAREWVSGRVGAWARGWVGGWVGAWVRGWVWYVNRAFRGGGDLTWWWPALYP